MQVCWLYSKVADSGDVVIQGQGISIVGTRVPAIATTLSFSYHSRGDHIERYTSVDIRPHRNQILLRGRHL